MPSLLIIGAGQYGRVAEEVAAATGKFDAIAFLDDNNPFAIGKVCESAKFLSQYEYAFVAIGNPDVRLSLMSELADVGYKLASLIHPRAYVFPSATIGIGAIVEPCAVVHTAAALGIGCIISAGAVVNHNATLGDGVHVDCNATVSARSIVPSKTKIISNTLYMSN